MCTTAAPARAASMAESAICSGVTGTWTLRPVVSPAPVIAQVMNTSWITSRALPRCVTEDLLPVEVLDIMAGLRVHPRRHVCPQRRQRVIDRLLESEAGRERRPAETVAFDR